MDTSSWFEHLPVIGNLPPEQAASKLREVGEEEAATLLEQAEGAPGQTFKLGERKGFWPFQDKPWQYTAHTFGYLASAASGNAEQDIRHIEQIAADPALRGARIKLTLNRLRIAAYPGGGIHHVLLHVFAQNQAPGRVEPMHFNATYRVQQGQSAGVQGYPLFTGLCVGEEGLILKCRTINVRNDQDEAFLSFLESDTFKTGLLLVTTAQPVLAPFSEMALGLVVRRDDQQQLIPYNYLVFGLSRYDGAQAHP